MRNLGIIILLAFFSINLSSCSTSSKKEIGIQLWSVRDAMKTDAEGTIAKLGEMGYSFVETAGYDNGKFYGMDPLAFKKLVNNNGMEFTSSHTGQALPSEENWDEVMAWWNTAIDAHAKAGVTYIVQPFMDKFGYGSKDDLQRYCDYFNAVGALCAEKDIKFGYHNHDKEFRTIDSTEIVRYDYMLQNTDPDKVFFQLDLYWIMIGQKNASDYFEQYPGRFLLWHVKDEKELGESGQMDFETIWAEKEKAGVQKYIVEVERYNFEPLVSVEKSIQFLMEQDYIK